MKAKIDHNTGRSKLRYPNAISAYEYKSSEAFYMLQKILSLKDELLIGGKYIVAMRIPNAEKYKAHCTLVAKYPKYALFKSDNGICTCLGYHAILTEDVLYLDELIPRRVTA